MTYRIVQEKANEDLHGDRRRLLVVLVLRKLPRAHIVRHVRFYHIYFDILIIHI